jgi:uncharacterized protein YjaZ
LPIFVTLAKPNIMTSKLLGVFLTIFVTIAASAQNDNPTKLADSFYQAKNYKAAAMAYLNVAEEDDWPTVKKGCFYNAACCYALDGDTAKAISYLEKSVYEWGYKNVDNVLNDGDLTSLHKTAQWKKIITYLKDNKKQLSNPRSAKLITSDIHNFWEAYDLVQNDTANMAAIYKAGYFDKASIGLRDYTFTKIGKQEYFVNNQRKKPKFYKAIRNNTLSVDTMKEQMYQSFEKFKALYDEASFPDIYFVIGRWNSAGTASDNGLLLGVDQIAQTPEIPTDELNLWEKNNFTPINRVPVIVAHELIHFQQDKIKRDTTLLCGALIEGMADFLAELIIGQNPAQRLQDFANGKRKKIWADFQQEMYLKRAYNWIANGDQERPDHPADLGYYMGYEICKAYYEKAADKKQAIKDILTFQNAKELLEKSGYAEKVAKQE